MSGLSSGGSGDTNVVFPATQAVSIADPLAVTIAATLPVSVAQTLPVSIAGTLPVSLAVPIDVNFPATQPVSLAGTLPVSIANPIDVNFPATQQVSLAGTMNVRKDVPDAFATSPDVSALNAATTLLAAADPLRSELILINSDATGDVYICGSSGSGAGQGIKLAPGAALTLDLRAAVYARNDSGGAVDVSVSSLGWSA
jgi:hypothetical protein